MYLSNLSIDLIWGKLAKSLSVKCTICVLFNHFSESHTLNMENLCVFLVLIIGDDLYEILLSSLEHRDQTDSDQIVPDVYIHHTFNKCHIIAGNHYIYQ